MPQDRFLLIEQPGTEWHGLVRKADAQWLKARFTLDERAALEAGRTVQGNWLGNPCTYTDLVAFHAAHRAKADAQARVADTPFARDLRHSCATPSPRQSTPKGAE